MKRRSRYPSLLPGHFTGFIKTITVFIFLFFLFFAAFSQDSLRLSMLPSMPHEPSTPVFTDTKKLMTLVPTRKNNFFYLQHIHFRPDTASLNARYKPSRNPMLLWKNQYPLSAEQINERDAEERRKNSAANQVLKTIFSRKKNVAVKPVL